MGELTLWPSMLSQPADTTSNISPCWQHACQVCYAVAWRPPAYWQPECQGCKKVWKT